MYRAILVPLDGSNFSERALPIALSIAQRDGAELHLVHVSGPAVPLYSVTADPVFDASLTRELSEEMQSYLASVQERVEEAATVKVFSDLLQGDIASAIKDYSSAHRVDLVVLSSHGRGGLNRTWLGSVAEGIVRHVHVPILMTRPDEDTPADLHRPIQVARVLVPLQDSEFSENMLAHAESLAVVLGAELVLMEVIVPVELHARALTAPVIDVDQEDLDSRLRRASYYLDEVASPLRRRGRVVSTRVVTAPHVATAIMNTADEVQADIIAMATHARRGLGRMLFGSVADKVVRGTGKSVLVIRPE